MKINGQWSPTSWSASLVAQLVNASDVPLCSPPRLNRMVFFCRNSPETLKNSDPDDQRGGQAHRRCWDTGWRERKAATTAVASAENWTPSRTEYFPNSRKRFFAEKKDSFSPPFTCELRKTLKGLCFDTFWAMYSAHVMLWFFVSPESKAQTFFNVREAQQISEYFERRSIVEP